jgi:hypothetical protein
MGGVIKVSPFLFIAGDQKPYFQVPDGHDGKFYRKFCETA